MCLVIIITRIIDMWLATLVELEQVCISLFVILIKFLQLICRFLNRIFTPPLQPYQDLSVGFHFVVFAFTYCALVLFQRFAPFPSLLLFFLQLSCSFYFYFIPQAFSCNRTIPFFCTQPVECVVSCTCQSCNLSKMIFQKPFAYSSTSRIN